MIGVGTGSALLALVNYPNLRSVDFHFEPKALLDAIARRPGIWDLDTFWKDYPIGIFRHVDTIYLRFPDKKVFSDDPQGADMNECHDQPAMQMLPEFRGVICGLLAHCDGDRLGRVMVNRLRPGAHIVPHSDTNGAKPYYDRIHLVLETNPEVWFRCGDKLLQAKAGEAWWIDNSREHEVVNNGKTDRTHLIVDIHRRDP